jgi:hypothetical protein
VSGLVKNSTRPTAFLAAGASGKEMHMAGIESFNDHCWKDVIPQADLDLYRGWRRETFVGERPALLAISMTWFIAADSTHRMSSMSATP